MGSIRDFIENHKKLTIIGGIVVVLGIIVMNGVEAKKAQKLEEEKQAYTDELLSQANQGGSDSDSLLMQMQDELVQTYGSLPDGFIWETDGTLLSLGDKDMTAEQVVYAYFRGLSTLDIGSVERYSRNSQVVQTYSDYFDESNKNTDYMDQFLRTMYRECLLSLEIEGIENSSVFAENKQVFSVKAKMLDLTDKDFWKTDQMTIYRNLYLYDSDESDSAKSDIYLYNYIADYYKSDKAKLRDVTFDITVQKYPDLDSGWLVSIDTDVDDACRYTDGKIVSSYIMDSYRNVGRELIAEEEKSSSSSAE